MIATDISHKLDELHDLKYGWDPERIALPLREDVFQLAFKILVLHVLDLDIAGLPEPKLELLPDEIDDFALDELLFGEPLRKSAETHRRRA